MSKILLSVVVFVCTITVASAQADTLKKQSLFEASMLTLLKQLDTTSGAAGFISLANSFERIGNAEKTKWQPYYYSSYCYAALAFLTQDKSQIDAIADKAEAYLLKAEEAEKNNSEITAMFAMINSCRILVDPMGRFQTKGKEVQAFLLKAMKENPNNPRAYLLQARMQLRTPEAFGGGAEIARKTAELAIEKFQTFHPENKLAPNWGSNQAKSLLDKINSGK